MNNAPPPIWFLKFWEENCHKLPMLMRGEGTMLLAWSIFNLLLEYIDRYAATPAGMKMIISFAKIQAMMVESQIIADSPDPSPERVAEAVRTLVERSKV
jgi:hypothetical protein